MMLTKRSIKWPLSVQMLGDSNPVLIPLMRRGVRSITCAEQFAWTGPKESAGMNDSFRIDGSYRIYEGLNGAAKFFIDADPMGESIKSFMKKRMKNETTRPNHREH